MPTLTAPSTVSFPLQIDQILTLTTNFGTGNVTLSAQKSGDIVYSYSNEQMQDSPVFSPGSQGIVTITHLTGSLTYNVTTSAFPLFDNTPRVLFQSGIPFILAGGTATNQFTVNSAGLVTALPTLPITSGFAFVYMPSGVTGTAGWYYAQVLSATSVQLYTARYTSGDPKLAVPTVLVVQSTTANNYSQLLTQIVAQQYTLPGGSMGPNGSITSRIVLLYTAVTSTIAYNLNFGGSAWASQTPGVNTNAIFNFATTAFNAGTASRQFSNNFWSDTSGGTGATPNFMSINTAADVVIQQQLTLNNAASVAVINNMRYELFYGA